MKRLALLFFLPLMAVGCATLSPQTKAVLAQPPGPPRARLETIQGLPRQDGDCGPIALSLVLQYAGSSVPPEDLRQELLTPKKQGTLPMSLISAARRRGMMAIPVSGMTALVQELAALHPVITFQNRGLSWLPNWHYATAIGYDLASQEIFFLDDLHPEPMPMTYVERHWELAQFWGLVVLPPGELAASASELEHLKAASGLEQVQLLPQARQAYDAILKRWPDSLGARIGLGNVNYQQGQFSDALLHLREAVRLHPNSPIARHNLRVAEETQSTKPR